MNIEIDIINREAEEDLSALVARSDSQYNAELLRVCDRLEAEGEGRKVLLLAGPSGSGKTTSAAIIEDTMRRRGHPAWDISLDDFYRLKSDPAYPRDESGQIDMESVHALRTDRIRECIASLLSGKETVVPRYEFGDGGRIIEDGERITVPDGGIVIIEGLHALNPLLTDGICAEGIYRMFISLSTNITRNGERIISGRKLRFIRRVVRDYYYRGMTADRTYKVWRSVLLGEDKYLYPYRHLADVTINTFHPCELAVMKPFAKEVLETLTIRSDYADTVKTAIAQFYGVPTSISQFSVPSTSLLREFMPPTPPFEKGGPKL